MNHDHIICYYHQTKRGTDCPDGIAAAWVVQRFYAHFYPHNALPVVLTGSVYGEPPTIEPDAYTTGIYIVDFSFPLDVVDRWLAQGIVINLFDHHITAKNLIGAALSDRFSDYVTQGFNPTFDMNECGATLAWKHLFPDQPMPAFLEFVRSRDLWLDCDLMADPIPDTLTAHEAVSRLKYQSAQRNAFPVFDMLCGMSREAFLEFCHDTVGDTLIEKRSKVMTIADRAEWLDFYIPHLDQWHSIPYVLLGTSEDRMTSDICSCLYRRHPDAFFVACMTSDGKFSLRSNKDGNDTDASAIALDYGGGGHRNASGFTPSASQWGFENERQTFGGEQS
jgi:oligoribonuclease NrnB/cAMP/cGMP phosphodiesterase (DHH superfamily)